MALFLFLAAGAHRADQVRPSSWETNIGGTPRDGYVRARRVRPWRQTRVSCGRPPGWHRLYVEEPVRFARLLLDFVKNTDPAEFEFSEEDLGLLQERMLARAKRTR